jgi:ABC-type Fe3+-hydroxamate transport system substrate-binding protein
MPPLRIVSLVPSLTELVAWFGLGERIVGRTRFCTEPPWLVDRVPVVGGTKNPRVDRVIALTPDIVLANREENRREDIEALQAAGLDVVLTDPNTVGEAIEMVLDLGRILGASERAAWLAHETAAAADEGNGPGLRVFVPIWKDPWMGLAAGTYGNDLLRVAGAVNVLGARSRYPEVTLDEVAALAPDTVLLPDEPYPFKDADRELFDGIAPARVVDGKLLWWYGPRMPGAIRGLRALLLEGR